MNIDRFNRDDESYILYLLESQKRVSNAELCKALSLSTSSVRKKLAKMEEKGLLIRTHGGAASIDADRDETMIKKSRVNIAQKKSDCTRCISISRFRGNHCSGRRVYDCRTCPLSSENEAHHRSDRLNDHGNPHHSQPEPGSTYQQRHRPRAYRLCGRTLFRYPVYPVHH